MFPPSKSTPTPRVHFTDTPILRLTEGKRHGAQSGLEGTDAEPIHALGFGPDGSQLAVTGGPGIVRIWDLRRIREQLRQIDLDWDLPVYSPARTNGNVTPVRAEVDIAAYERLAASRKELDAGQAHARAGRWPQAVELFTKAIELDPTSPEAWNGRGHAHMKGTQFEKAVADSSKAIELAPMLVEAWFVRGYCCIHLSRLDQAVTDLSKAIDLDSTNADAWNYRGLAFANLDQPEKALGDYRSALKLFPDSAIVRRNMSWLLATCPNEKLRDVRQAVEHAQKAVELRPKLGSCWKALGVAHYRAGDWKLAVAALDKSVELVPEGDAVTQLFLAMAHRKSGNPKEAGMAYDQAVLWLQKNKGVLEKNMPRAEEVRRFRSEAEEVLKRGV